MDALAVYRAAGVIRGRHERAGRLYAMGRRATFGGVYPISTVLARMVAGSLPQSIDEANAWARWEMLTDDDREEKRAGLEEAIGRADCHLLRTAGAAVRGIERVLCLDGDRIRARHEGALVIGLGLLASWWGIRGEELGYEWQ